MLHAITKCGTKKLIQRDYS